MSKNYLRAYSTELERVQAEEPGSAIRFVASTEGIKRDGKDLRAEDWDLANFKKNPVFLWVHDYMGSRPPIGKVADVELQGQQMSVDVVFDQQDDFARQVESKYRRGFLNAVSVGWDEMRVAQGEKTKLDLLDVSGVPVPGDPDALIERQYRALQHVFEEENKDGRSAIPPHSTAKAAENAAWDGPGEVAKAPAERAALRKMFSWVDDEADPDTKRAYKLPHHKASGEVVWRGVAAAMSRLFQSGTKIPDSDRRGVYNHLRRHYQQFDKEPPEFRSNEELAKLTPALIRGLFYADEPELFPWMFVEYDLTRQEHDELKQAIAILQDIAANVVPHDPEPPENDGGEPDAEAEAAAALNKIIEQLDTYGENDDVEN